MTDGVFESTRAGLNAEPDADSAETLEWVGRLNGLGESEAAITRMRAALAVDETCGPAFMEALVPGASAQVVARSQEPAFAAQCRAVVALIIRRSLQFGVILARPVGGLSYGDVRQGFLTIRVGTVANAFGDDVEAQIAIIEQSLASE